jgi:hypothetical protein
MLHAQPILSLSDGLDNHVGRLCQGLFKC